MIVRRRMSVGALAAALSVGACAPRLTPLIGVPKPASVLPRADLPQGHHKIIFTWELQDRDFRTKGDGAAQLASPDSARLDFFLGGGFGSGAAVLIGDSLRTPPGSGDLARRFVPPPPLLWAVLGRVALPNLPDTVIRVEGVTLRADVGQPVAWRLSFHGDTLFRAERVSGGRVEEWVERTDSNHVRYHNSGGRRTLELTVTRTEEVSEFDASTWRFDR